MSTTPSDSADNSSSPSSQRLQCRCGGVELEITAPPIAQFYCHCDDCQVVHGAAYVPESVYPAGAVRVTRGEPLTWALRRSPRFTCPACASIGSRCPHRPARPRH